MKNLLSSFLKFFSDGYYFKRTENDNFLLNLFKSLFDQDYTSIYINQKEVSIEIILRLSGNLIHCHINIFFLLF